MAAQQRSIMTFFKKAPAPAAPAAAVSPAAAAMSPGLPQAGLVTPAVSTGARAAAPPPLRSRADLTLGGGCARASQAARAP